MRVDRVGSERELWEDGSAPVATSKSLLLSLRNVYETLHVSAPTVLDALRGTLSREICDERIARWTERVVANTAMRITVRGRDHIPSGPDPRGYLIMSNHQSHYDVAVVYYVFGPSIRMVAKRELFDLPIFGRAIRAGGFVSVDRKDTKSAIASLEDVKHKLANGTPVWIAPEGTRSRTGELLPFKKGGFVLSLETGAPILPVSIRGTRDVLRAHGVRSKRGVEVVVTIHPAVDPKRFAGMPPREARDALAEEVRRSIARGL